MIYEDLLNLLQNRRTSRLVDTSDIDIEDITKILEAIKYAPSFDKVYPYKIVALTNSPEAITVKENLIKYYRCAKPNGTTPSVDSSFDDLEMVQPILSGLTLVFVATPKPSSTMKEGIINLQMIAVKDATIAATLAMLTGESLGLKTGMFGCVQQIHNVTAMFTDAPLARYVMAVTFAKKIIPHTNETKSRQYFDLDSNTRPFAYRNKHRNINNTPLIQVI
jgi:nitroreductase